MLRDLVGLTKAVFKIPNTAEIETTDIEKEESPRGLGLVGCAMFTAVISILASILLAGPVSMLFGVPHAMDVPQGELLEFLLYMTVMSAFVGVAYGGFLIPAVLGCFAGCLVYWHGPRDGMKRNQSMILAGVLSALPGVVCFSILVHIN